MKVSGTAVLHGPVETVYAVLNDPAVLVQTIPGCERLEQVGPDAYKATVTAGVASIKGSYAGEVALTDQQAPYSFVLHAAGAGAAGTISADVTVTLADDGAGTTRLFYDAEAVVGGMVGGVGQRILAGVAKKTAGEFFAAVDSVLTGAEPVVAVTAAVGEAQALPPATAPGPTMPTVFTRPAEPAASTSGVRLSGRPGVRPGKEFAFGVAVGAGIALLGAVVGGLVAGRAAHRH